MKTYEVRFWNPDRELDLFGMTISSPIPLDNDTLQGMLVRAIDSTEFEGLAEDFPIKIIEVN